MSEFTHDEACDKCKIIINCGGGHHHKRCECPAAEYAEIYSQLEQQLTPSGAPNQPGGFAMFEKTVVATSNVDISMANINGRVTVNRSGWYDVNTGVCGTLNPVSSPLLAWSMSVFLNGTLIQGSTTANMTLSPEQKANDIVADVFVHLNAGDYLQLANTSTSPLLLSAPTQGSNAQPNSCYLKIVLLQAD